MAPKKKQNKIEYHPKLARERKKTRAVVIAFSIFATLVILIIGYAFLYEKVLKYNKPVAIVGEKTVSGETLDQRVRLERNSYILEYNRIAAEATIYADSQESINTYKQQLTQLISILDDKDFFGESILDNIIDEQIISIEAEKMGLSVSEEEIELQIQQLFRYYPDGKPEAKATLETQPTSTLSATQEAFLSSAVTSTPSQEITEVVSEEFSVETESTATQEIEEIPTATAEGESPQQVEEEPLPTNTPFPTPTPYTQDIYLQNYNEYIDGLATIGVEESSFREYIRMYLLTQKVFDEIVSEITRIQDQVWARHILVETYNEAVIVSNRLESDDEWNTVCNEVTLDKSGKENCGDLDWFPRGQMVEIFENTAFEMEVGEVSNPIETQFGFHIIQVLGREKRQIVENYDFERLQGNFYNKWFLEIKENIEIIKNSNWKDHVPAEPSIAPEMRIQ